uniref:U3 n=3 Tax=Roseolovirus TaxID=40272 RepID=A0A1W6D8V2_9BETA|nr:tegument protein UL24 [Human betaherpesvirus 6B]ARJ98801.1 U3 [Human betaherpesvirus 6]APO37019.1 tegument protein UL24 [Human betaherpesvirus 6B]APO37103.1 tegument protein UL24 [Human betaherpesvirus 6B]APO37189.1 tegument protein UL24 [Human betaherpesvirus 6B]
METTNSRRVSSAQRQILATATVRFIEGLHEPAQDSMMCGDDELQSQERMKKRQRLYNKSKRDLVDLLRVYTCLNSVRMFTFVNFGRRIPLAWPEGYELVINNCRDENEYADEKLGELADLVCCRERLVVLGYVKKRGEIGSEPAYWFLKGDIVVLLGGAGRVYAHTWLLPQQLCRVGDTIDDFLRKGLKRFYYAHQLVSSLQFVVEDTEVDGVCSCRDVLCFRDRHIGRSFALRWPKNETLLFHRRRDSFVFVRCDEARRRLAEMCFFGSFGYKYFADAGRISLYVADDGRIFGFNDNDEDGRPRFVAENFQQFRRIGVIQYYKSYVFRREQPEWALLPTCHLSRMFYQKTWRQADDDLLFVKARNDERQEFPDAGTRSAVHDVVR